MLKGCTSLRQREVSESIDPICFSRVDPYWPCTANPRTKNLDISQGLAQADSYIYIYIYIRGGSPLNELDSQISTVATIMIIIIVVIVVIVRIMIVVVIIIIIVYIYIYIYIYRERERSTSRLWILSPVDS